MFINMFISEPKECAILYAGINQTGAVANILEGEFEHASNSNNPVMPLGDDSESVYVYPVRAQVFAIASCAGNDDRLFLT